MKRANASVPALICALVACSLLANSQCSQQWYEPGLGLISGASGTVNLQLQGMPSSEVEDAIDDWSGTCPQMGSGFADFAIGSGSGPTVGVQLHSTGTSPYGGCGYFDAELTQNASGLWQVSGGQIHVYTQTPAGNDCGAPSQTLIHEFGHVLGLADGPDLGPDICWNAMAARYPTGFGTLTSRFVWSDDCVTADEASSSAPPDDGGGTVAVGDGGSDHSPILLDLGKPGLALRGLDDAVTFDIDADGVVDRISWVENGSEDGFLWIDLNHNSSVDDGSELFGNATVLPSGSQAKHGFEALEVYDLLEFGGNGDGLISPLDAVWNELRVWVDRNGNAVAELDEVQTLDECWIRDLSLTYRTSGRHDKYGNLLRYWSFFKFYDQAGHVKRAKAFDVFFLIEE